MLRMLSRRWTSRLLLALSAAAFLAVGLALRATTDGVVQNASGTALYASLVYVGIVFAVPRIGPWLAGAIAVGFCWLVELSQLTGVPADLSERSLAARLVLGVKFDPADMLWYPVGVIPLVAAHVMIQRAVAARQPDR
jgi:hypothetical protein